MRYDTVRALSQVDLYKSVKQPMSESKHGNLNCYMGGFAMTPPMGILCTVFILNPFFLPKKRLALWRIFCNTAYGKRGVLYSHQAHCFYLRYAHL